MTNPTPYLDIAGVKLLAERLASGLRQQDDGVIDLSPNHDLSVFQVFEPINLVQLSEWLVSGNERYLIGLSDSGKRIADRICNPSNAPEAAKA